MEIVPVPRNPVRILLWIAVIKVAAVAFWKNILYGVSCKCFIEVVLTSLLLLGNGMPPAAVPLFVSVRIGMPSSYRPSGKNSKKKPV